MSVGFGFSAGDFISALELVTTVVDALRDSGASSTEYRALISQLHTLETALLRVKRVELDDSQHAEVVALRQAASQCQRTIDVFWEKIQKYQPSLRAGGSESRVKDGWMKIKWALCRKEDLVRFKADLMGHTESIEMLLTTVQMAATRLDSKKNDQHHRTLAGRVQESYFGCMQKMTVILEKVSTGIQQGKQLLELTRKIIETNVQVFQIVLNIQNVITRIPGQVDRQQPVYFVDALGRNMSFDLEFIMSADALKSVLCCNFKTIGSGAAKIEKGEFAIQDSATLKDVDLSSPWETCFYPKQHVAMSMVFNSQRPITHCPKCFADSVAQDDEDVECDKCHMIYRRSTAVKSVESLQIPFSPPNEPQSVLDIESDDFYPFIHNAGKSSQLKRRRIESEEDEMALFRRVRIKTSIFIPAKDSRPGSPYSTSSATSVWSHTPSLRGISPNPEPGGGLDPEENIQRTISPKDVGVVYHESEEDARMPLFPLQQHQMSTAQYDQRLSFTRGESSDIAMVEAPPHDPEPLGPRMRKSLSPFSSPSPRLAPSQSPRSGFRRDYDDAAPWVLPPPSSFVATRLSPGISRPLYNSPASVTLTSSSGANPWQNHHYISRAAATAPPQSQDRFICPTCNKAFSRPSSLRIHSHSHTGEKPFKCPHPGCGKAFAVRSNMKRHERGCLFSEGLVDNIQVSEALVG